MHVAEEQQGLKIRKKLNFSESGTYDYRTSSTTFQLHSSLQSIKHVQNTIANN